MINYNDIDLIVKVAKMCAKKAGLPDQDVISLGALRQALDIYCNLPGTETVCVDGQGSDQLRLLYDYKTNLLNVWTVGDGAEVNLDMYEVEDLITYLQQMHKSMVYIKYNNLYEELASHADKWW